jgi:alanyl-tRNA synthetase
LIDKFGGKGGGRPDLVQGGGLQGDADEIAAFATSLVQP